jgi:hypothetical protein
MINDKDYSVTGMEDIAIAPALIPGAGFYKLIYFSKCYNNISLTFLMLMHREKIRMQWIASFLFCNRLSL